MKKEVGPVGSGNLTCCSLLRFPAGLKYVKIDLDIAKHNLAWPDRFFLFFFVVAEKRVWNSLQAVLVLTLPDGTGSVNKRNVIHTYLVAASA